MNEASLGKGRVMKCERFDRTESVEERESEVLRK